MKMNLLVCLPLVYAVVTWKNAVVFAGWCEANGAPRENIIHSCTNETRESNTSLYIEPKMNILNGVVERVTCNCVMQHNSPKTLRSTLKVAVTVSDDGASFKFRANLFKHNRSRLNYELDGRDEFVSTEVLNTQTICANLTLGHYFSITCSNYVTRVAVSDTDNDIRDKTTQPNRSRTVSSTSTSTDTTTSLNENQSSSTNSAIEAESAGMGVAFNKNELEGTSSISPGGVGAVITCCVLVPLIVIGGVFFYRRKYNLDGKAMFNSFKARFSTQNNENDGNTRTNDGHCSLDFMDNKGHNHPTRIVKVNNSSDGNYENLFDKLEPSDPYENMPSPIQEYTQANNHYEILMDELKPSETYDTIPSLK